MLSRRETSIALQTDKTPAEYVALAQLIDEFAFDVVSVYNDLPYHPAFGPLFLMAPHLHRARIGPAGVSPTRMAPIDMAANVALLHACAPAGAYLGIVRGAWGERFGIPPLRAPLRDMRDCTRIVQQLLHGEAIHPQSHAFPVPADARLALPLPETEIPLLIGTWGSRLAHIACAFANEVKIGGSANPRLAARMACILRAGESEHNRAPGEVRMVLGCVTVVAEDRAAAREKARRAAARYLTVVLPLDPTISSGASAAGAPGRLPRPRGRRWRRQPHFRRAAGCLRARRAAQRYHRALRRTLRSRRGPHRIWHAAWPLERRWHLAARQTRPAFAKMKVHMPRRNSGQW